MTKGALWLQTAWQRKARWLWLLRPLAWLYGVVSQRQKNAYLLGKKPRYHAPVPVLVIGNITVGGSGKTPLIIALVTYLKTQGVAVGVISRGYGGSAAYPSMVSATCDPKLVGDEPCLIATKTAAPVAIAKKRQDAITLLLKNHPTLQMIISDDGLQHHALAREAEWIVVDVARGFGNGWLLPAGFLREPIDRLQGAVVIYHEPSPSGDYPLSMHLLTKTPVALDASFRPVPKGVVYALTAIGYPTRFFDSLQHLGFLVIAKAYPDHYYFTLDDIKELTDHPIIVTEKDAIKLARLQHDHPSETIFGNVWVLPVEMQLSDEVYHLMTQFIAEHL